MELDYRAIGEQIRQRRQRKGLTQSSLAEQAGIEPSNISHIERATSRIGLSTLVKIANILECTTNDLLQRLLTKGTANHYGSDLSFERFSAQEKYGLTATKTLDQIGDRQNRLKKRIEVFKKM